MVWDQACFVPMHCKHCPPTCRMEHDAPPEVDCADCCAAYEKYLDTIRERIMKEG